MSATNRTTYYNLPIFIGTDTPSWLGDWNNTMNDIDSAINGVHTEAQSAANTANSASSKSDANTESIGAIQTEIQTIKTAVQNYDSILDFDQIDTVFSPNNVTDNDSSAKLIVQNTNKTINKMMFYFNLSKLTNPTTYTYTGTSRNGSFLDLITIEDNAFKMNQGSLPSATICLTLGIIEIVSSNGENRAPVYLRAWFDGVTTHIGIVIYGAATTYADYTVMFNGTLLVSGSVYNPDDTDK